MFYQRDYTRDFLEIQQSIHNKKIIVGVDAFECSWNLAYRKSHIAHFVVLDEIRDGKFFCYDPYISDKQYEMGLEELKKSYRNVRIFPESIAASKLEIEPVELCRLLLYEYSEESIFGVEDSFESFAEALESVKELSELYDFADVRICGIIQKIKTLMGVRLSIAYMLMCMEQNKGLQGIKGVYRDFFQMAEMFQMLNVQLMKTRYAGKIVQERLSEMSVLVKTLGELEKKTYLLIREYLEE